ncbi:hypothetical protein AALO_G00029230 [Alosa alosa]|uniref:Thioredoxin domain-containing protein n=1 Tax=Alosa alosa TaxID=278164 RepID=A0AAV6HBJ9_9TELE|nr:thioredoxin domain-containing protein 15 [Alosa alosa]KAG5284673.1 hypothetical protein AALO_G00029230 [Alosa alosa]
MGCAVITLEFLYILSFSLFVISFTASPDKDDVPEFKVSDDYMDAEQTLEYTMEETQVVTKQQYKTAEIADAVMGIEVPPSSAGIKSLIPNSADPITGFTAPCDEETCVSETPEEADELDVKENEERLTLEMIHTDSLASDENATETAKTYKVNCDKRNITGMDNFTVQVLNASQDLMDFLNVNGTECSLVLFFTTWCQFSASLAPHFNAVPRVFPTMHFLALDASQHGSLSTRFGTVAVPNILLFQGVKPMARFNHTDRTLETLTSFIVNQTGFEAISDQIVTEEDTIGPLPSVPVKSIDWLLAFSILFIIGFTVYAILRTDSVRWLIPGQDHEHQD